MQANMKRVLFACKRNSCRSQMAEGVARILVYRLAYNGEGSWN
jgi:protein-tyrosine-phosphatase